jgi:hypothetical protein
VVAMRLRDLFEQVYLDALINAKENSKVLMLKKRHAKQSKYQ